jgi:hypothetical protein
MTCFVCLKTTGSKRCSRCSIRAHAPCWSEFVSFKRRHASFETEWSINCPQCSLPLQTNPHRTRSVANSTNRQVLFLQTISDLVRDVTLAPDENSRKGVASTLFEYICTHRELLDQNPRLKDILEQKLLDLYDEGWEEAYVYYERLFG